jgi:hypothetical protein
MTIHVPHQIRPPPNSNPATRGSTRLVPGGTDWFSGKTGHLAANCPGRSLFFQMIGNFSERPESLMNLKRHVIERRCDTCDRDYSRLLICQFRRRAVARDVWLQSNRLKSPFSSVK